MFPWNRNGKHSFRKHYTGNILVRPYVTIGNVNYYGAVKRETLYNAAKNCPEQDNETIKEIIAKGDSEKA